MENRLPDELLREILKYCLHISPVHAFLLDPAWQWYNHHTEYEAPLLMPRSDPLAVSKRWLRVGSPLFYQTVILYSTAQVRQLAQLFRAHPELGAAVRNLRLQAGFGKDLVTIVKHAPNVRALAVNMEATASESTVGILRVLPLLNPVRFYLHGSATPRLANRKSIGVRDAVVESLSKWENLVSPPGLTLSSIVCH